MQPPASAHPGLRRDCAGTHARVMDFPHENGGRYSRCASPTIQSRNSAISGRWSAPRV